MSDDGPSRLGAPQIQCGPVAGTRWTVLRVMAPAQRQRGKLLWQHRMLCRCVCGATQAVWEFDLLSGRSSGCSSARCRNGDRMETVSRLRGRVAANLERIDRLIAEINQAEAEAEAIERRVRGRWWRGCA